ncbi:MAG: hypothetical protein ACRCWJ_12900 [Casimicrobium sp.]
MNAVQIALAALAAALIGALGWMTDWGQDFSAEPDIASRKVSAKIEGASVLPDFKLGSESNAYTQIAERPLLNPTRKPAPTQPIAQVAPEPPKPQIRRGLYQLVGVSDFGGVKVAQVRELAGNRVRTVRLGDMLQELKVVRIDSSKLVLDFQGEKDEVALASFTASGRVPVPPPASAPQALGAPPLPPQSVPAMQQLPTGQSAALPSQQASPLILQGASAPAPPSGQVLEERRARRAAFDARMTSPPPPSGLGPTSR